MLSKTQELRRYGLFARPWISWVAAAIAILMVAIYLIQGTAFAYPNLLGHEPSTLDRLTHEASFTTLFMKSLFLVMVGMNLWSFVGLVRQPESWLLVQATSTFTLALSFGIIALLGMEGQDGSPELATQFEGGIAVILFCASMACAADLTHCKRQAKVDRTPTAP